ncbi:ATP-binding protein [Noviherbaspirillum sp. ST9]|uniref:hybrid sensor histidine kinase/response regulator n=1 Tax=Noviherbaspirillum sp. ST9 TaxID=3401606 RepID=UPI003B586CBF
MPHSLSPERKQQRTLAWLQTSFVMAALLPLMLFFGVAVVRYHQIYQERQNDTARLSHIVAEHALKLFDTNEVTLSRMVELVKGETDAALRANEEAYHRTLRAMTSELPQVQSTWITGADGSVVLTNRYFPAPRDLNLGDREFFRYHQNGGQGLHITGVLIGKKTREPFFDLTRRRTAADGSFAGTVNVSLRPSYLIDFYQRIASRESALTLSLVRSDGAVIARWPDTAEAGQPVAFKNELLEQMENAVAEGNIKAASGIDGVERIGSFHRLANYPIYAYAGYTYASIRNEWLRDLAVLALFAVPFSIAFGVIGVIVMRQTRRELQTAERLRVESEHRKKMEEALHHSQRLEALRHLTGGVAHDFNNLLMAVELSATLLRHTVPQLAGNVRLEAIERAVASGAKLTRQLLSFSRSQPLMPATIDLGRTLNKVTELCKPVLGSNITLQMKVKPGTPAVRLDPGELELALLNLAINARHAMPDGGQFDIVAAPLRWTARDWVEIRVSDTGHGIAPELRERVFEPFFTTKEPGKGTGLGLSQVYGMCQRAGGTAVIESTVGKGTTVILRLPGFTLGTEEIAVDGILSDRAEPLSVLLVEDNEEIADVSIAALKMLGCDVKHCDGAYAALACLEQEHEHIDLVLSDIVMPGEMDGIELLRFIRGRYPHLSVALMTGYTERLDAAEGLNVPILSKPFSVKALGELLAQTARQKKAPDAGDQAVSMRA